ncbi:hypothetical protein [Streptomyces sp. NRRL S-118]|uniref:hypothetical protein n=1 Tax=Streptomyces sp. NRRL S-118 TaxID=1463881 RepID=UPI0004C8988D|nr:hypothetical protein [Streptomyces sp. NRRL S-118]
MKTGRLIVPGVFALVAVFSSGTAAHADEARTASDNGHHITLLSIGQIDDPMEDVLEHVSILGSNEVNGS